MTETSVRVLSTANRFACPSCFGQRTRITDSRPSGTTRRRSYLCLDCGTRFAGIEIPVLNIGSGSDTEHILNQTVLSLCTNRELLDELKRRLTK